MKLGLYYHLPILLDQKHLKISGLLGVFIEHLAKQCDTLYLFLHQANDEEKKECDYQLDGVNIEWVNLGIKNPAWSRDLFHTFKLPKFKNQLKLLDALIVRSPTPYGPYFQKHISKNKIVYLIVGDYRDGANNLRVRSFRDYLVKKYVTRNDTKFTNVLKNANVVVNSNVLYEKYKSSNPKILLVRTTTLREDDFYKRVNTCLGEEINLLYTGRLDMAKGLVELISSVAKLIESYPKKICLNIVGWDTDQNQKNLIELQNLVKKLNITKEVIFHGKKTIGHELNSFYRAADIYVFPSYFEGFPRTIWEAMANSLPIVCTAVGGIPYVLKDKKHVLFAEPKKIDSLTKAITSMLENRSLREEVIRASYLLSLDNTLDKQTELLVNGIKKYISVKKT